MIGEQLARERPGARGWLAVGSAAALAAFLFLFQIGSSSFFIDETASMRVVAVPLDGLLEKLRVAENSPGGYFLLLDVWTAVAGSKGEWVARLPSALAGVALVVVVWRLGALVAGPRTGLVAALLTAVSPLVLQYAQQARPYAVTMLALAVAALAVVETRRRRSWAWLLTGAAACALALSFHYASLSVVAPVCAWVLLRSGLERRMRLAFCAIPAAAWLAWLPLALAQRADHPSAQLGGYGNLTVEHAVRVLGAPFDDRYSEEIGVLKWIAAAIVVAALAAAARRRSRAPELELMVAVSVVQVLALVAGALMSFEILNSRYMTFALPFMLVAVAAGLAHARALVALPLLGLLVAVAAVGVLGSHRRSGFYPDTRGVAAAIARDWRPGDVIVGQTTLGASFPLQWYVERRLPRGTTVLDATAPATRQALARRPRLWIVRLHPPLPGSDPRTPPGYRRVALRRFPAIAELRLELATPAGQPG